MIKLVLFDIDGTLVHTGRAGMKAFAQTFANEFGVADGSEKLKFAGRTDYSLVREFFLHNQIEPSKANFDRFFAAYLLLLAKIILESDGHICHGTLDFMQQLRALPEPPLFALLTGNVRDGARIKLNHFNLWQEFSTGAFADDHEERDCIAAIARQRGAGILKQTLADNEVLVIGDTPLDIRCARAIKARVLAVATGSSTVNELSNHHPDWAVENLSAISAKEICLD